jgi:hypothetical protein
LIKLAQGRVSFVIAVAAFRSHTIVVILVSVSFTMNGIINTVENM